jgi:hypothetical protein
MRRFSAPQANVPSTAEKDGPAREQMPKVLAIRHPRADSASFVVKYPRGSG